MSLISQRERIFMTGILARVKLLQMSRGRLLRPYTGKYFNGRPRHVNVVVFLRPMKLEIAAAQVCGNRSFGSPRQHAGDRDGASSSAARHRLTRAAFPYADGHVTR